MLWGAGVHDRSLTPEGRALFLNLCAALISSPSGEAVFPEKTFLKVGENRAVLKGGHRDIYSVKPLAAGTLRLTLKWNRGHDMMLMTDKDRVDGKSPLSTTWEVAQGDLGTALMVVVGSFDLEEGVESPYSLILSSP